MNKNYETVIIFTPVLNDEEVKKQIKKYVDMIKDAGGSIVHEDHWGLKQMAYPIQKKTTGIYHIVEYDAPGEFIDTFELQFRRDENVIRFLTTALDKYALDYNERKRNGLIGRKKEPKVTEPVVPNVAASTATASAATATVEAPVVTEPVVEKVEEKVVEKVEEAVEPAVSAEPVVEEATGPPATEAPATPEATETTVDPETPPTDTSTEPEQKADEA